MTNLSKQKCTNPFCKDGQTSDGSCFRCQGTGMMDAQPTSNLRYEVEFPCGHTVAHEENCPRCENDRLRAALRLILPLAKGYSPPGQSESARRTCNEWIAAAEAQLSGDSSAPTSIPSNLRTFLGKVADLGCSTVDSSGKCIACEAADFLRGPLPDETEPNPVVCNNHDRSGTAYGYQPDPTDVVTRGAVVYGSLTARDPNDLTRELWTMTKYWRLAPSAEKATVPHQYATEGPCHICGGQPSDAIHSAPNGGTDGV